MKRNYDDGVAGDVTLFVGVEVENTPMKGRKTLFVVGIQDPIVLYEYCTKFNISHVYLGANMSFDGSKIGEWEMMARFLLTKGIWVTLDFDVKHATLIESTHLNEFNNFISMISVKVPKVQNFNYNACIKIDDRDFAATNPGVWVHQLHDLMDRDTFTDWSKYTQDQVLERTKKDVDDNSKAM